MLPHHTVQKSIMYVSTRRCPQEHVRTFIEVVSHAENEIWFHRGSNSSHECRNSRLILGAIPAPIPNLDHDTVSGNIPSDIGMIMQAFIEHGP